MSKASEFQTYAGECLLWAKNADSVEKRNQCLDLARIWIEAAAKAGGRDVEVDVAIEPLEWKAR